MNLTTKQILIASLGLLLLGAAFGRFTTPEKVRVETKTVTVEVEKKQEQQKTNTDTDRDRHRETTTTEITKPDGTREVVTHTTDDTKTDRHTDQVKNTDTESTKNESASTMKEVTRGSSPVTVSALLGVKLSLSSPVVYGAAVSRPILGPVTVGAFGMSDATLGVSLGLTF